MQRSIILVGGGGHCHSVIDSILASDCYERIGIVDLQSIQYLNIPYLGTDDNLAELHENGWTEAFITIGSVGKTESRRRVFSRVKAIGYAVPSVIDPSAVLANDVTLGEGIFIGKGSIVNSGTEIGNCAIINTGAIVEHDCKIGDFCHISPGSVLCGEVEVGVDTHIGAGSVIRQQLSIGSHSLIGMGSVVTKNIPSCVEAYGNPCKER